MDFSLRAKLEQLRTLGWQLEDFGSLKVLPIEIVRRYPWIPSDYRTFAEEVRLACSPDDKSWFLTALDFKSESDSAFAWNEWERQSLDVAQVSEKAEIVAFWNEHLPILLSLKSGHGYLAIERSGAVVCGEEPEYEETTIVAPSFSALLQLIADRDPRLALLR